MKALVFFLAAMSALGADLVGKWDFVWQTAGGERRSTLTFAMEKGALQVSFPDAKPMAATVDGSKLTVNGRLFAVEAGVEGSFQLAGVVDGDRITGTAAWEEHEMNFEAKRQAPAAAAAKWVRPGQRNTTSRTFVQREVPAGPSASSVTTYSPAAL